MPVSGLGSVTSLASTRSANRENQWSWVERTFFKRQCTRFIPTKTDKERCGCGRRYVEHAPQVDDGPAAQGEKWTIDKHTENVPTDAYGTLEFQGVANANKAQYVRLSHDTPPEVILQLLTRQWDRDLPRLLISVHGGIANFQLQPRLARVFKTGLLRAARTTGAWIFTAGTNTGVMRHVGEALSDMSTKDRGRVALMGIAPWGVVENRHHLTGKETVCPYIAVTSPRNNFSELNSAHSHFLLPDNGTVGKYGGEILLRKRLEKHIQSQRIHIRSGAKAHGVPVVCLVLEGGTNVIRTVLDYVTDQPPVPVVVCDGSGRAADLIAFTHKYSNTDGTMPEVLRDQLILTIRKTFQYSKDQATRVFIELMLCCKKRELVRRRNPFCIVVCRVV